MGETYLDLKTVAEKLEINIQTLRVAIDNQELSAVKGVWPGYRTTETWVKEWLDRKTLKATSGKAGGK